MIVDIWINNKHHSYIEWVANEAFALPTETKFYNLEMDAESILNREDLSTGQKILLSAVAGAVIQQLIYQGVDMNDIFDNGYFTILDTLPEDREKGLVTNHGN